MTFGFLILRYILSVSLIIIVSA